MNLFKDRLAQALKLNNLKFADLIELSKVYWEDCGCKLTMSDISNFVNGVYEPSKKKLELISKTLDIDESWLLGYSNSSVSDEEELLLNAWRLAPESTKETIAFMLRDYGMTYTSAKKMQNEAIS